MEKKYEFCKMNVVGRFVCVVLCVFGLFSCSESSHSMYNMPVLNKAAKPIDSSVKLGSLSDAILDNPSEPLNYIKRSQLYLEIGDTKEALIDINRAEKLNPNNYDVLFQKALVLSKMNDKNALEYALKSESLGNESLALYNFLANDYLNIKKRQRAGFYINKMETIYPYDYNLQLTKGNFFLKGGDTSTAFAFYKKAVEFGPNKMEGYNILVDNYLGLSILDSALKYNRKAIARFPGTEKLEISNAAIFERAGVSDSAIAIYKGILLKNPERNDILEKIGNVYFRRKNYSSAFLIFDQLFKKDDTNADYLLKATECYVQRDQYTKALEYLREKGEDLEEDPNVQKKIGALSYRVESSVQIDEYPEPEELTEAPKPTRKEKPKIVQPAEPERIFKGKIGTIERIPQRKSQDSTRN